MPACLEIDLGVLGPILSGVGGVLLHLAFNQSSFSALQSLRCGDLVAVRRHFVSRQSLP
jgi:hypothetical protein